ncbi:SDR family oxidoreductase [Kallotenue papyrolyticum]|uniref:SDR family oxidoreductase n=1 Tax=Kallotenue papyrolyticum TaxID=1325125 RepID=UPI0004785C5A|nr:SDR family oxidoreductase [Kallotenue papyrolyticum]
MSVLQELFGLDGQVAIVTGGTGALGSALARGLARAGARVALVARRREPAEALAAELVAAGGAALAVPADVLDRARLEQARDAVLARWGRIDILVNAAGGNLPAATVSAEGSFFDLPCAALEQVVALNLHGTLLPTQVFGAVMAQAGQGCIVNISSMAAQRALTRVVGYGAAKAAVENVTRWLAVELGRRYGAGLRVNAIAPGFFVGEQNRALLLEPDGRLTPRGQTIIAHTPAGRFGEPDDLIGTLLWLCGPGARFVTGVVVPVDGGFSAWSGV